jgi:hypothetical protein
MAGFKSERVAGFKLECMAGFIGILTTPCASTRICRKSNAPSPVSRTSSTCGRSIIRPHRVEAHIFVAALAFLLHRAIEKKLKAAHLDLSATEALTVLKSVRVVDIELGDGTTKRSVTPGTQRAAVALRAPRHRCRMP